LTALTLDEDAAARRFIIQRILRGHLNFEPQKYDLMRRNVDREVSHNHPPYSDVGHYKEVRSYIVLMQCEIKYLQSAAIGDLATGGGIV
jgi:hypothetical protein